MGRLKYILICATIWKCIFIAESAEIDTKKLKSLGLDPDILKKNVVVKAIKAANEDQLNDLLEAFKTMYTSGNETGFQCGNETGFKCGNETGFKCGDQNGFKRGAEFLGSLAFECAITRAKSVLENMMRARMLNDVMKEYSKGYSQTELSSVNKTRDEWIHINLLTDRQNNPAKQKINPKNFIHEISLGFGRCLYELKDGDLNYMSLIRNSLSQYLLTINKATGVNWSIEQLEREFCGSISRTYQLLNVIVNKHMDQIKAVPQSDGNTKKYFQDALFEVIPTWYMRSQDITYLNIFRYSYSHFKNYKNYVPITPYFTMNRWGDKKSGPDSVVLPLLYNSTECGLIPNDKTIPPSSSAATFSFDIIGITLATQPAYWPIETPSQTTNQ